MNWYGFTKKADWGHEDTLEGQFMKRFFHEVRDDVVLLREAAYQGGPEGILPRWQGEVRRRCLLLPPEDRLRHMSMYELKEVRARVDDIKSTMSRYSERRFTEIFNADQAS